MRLLSKIEALLNDEDLGVRREAIYFLCLKQRERAEEILRGFLSHENPRLQTAAIAAMAEHQMEEAHALLTEDTLEIFLVRSDEDAETGREEVAKLLGLLQGEHYRVFLAQLMADTSPRVVKAAIASAGRKRDPDFIPHLLEMLPNSTYRHDTKEALAGYGVEILPQLQELLLSESERLMIRRNIPSVIARIESQRSVDILTEALLNIRPDLKFYVVKALNRLRNQGGGMKFPEARLDAVLLDETRSYFEILKILSFHTQFDSDNPARLLKRALQERLDLNLERIFRLLGLAYPPKDIFTAYLGITSTSRLSRANALEFLENVLRGEIKRCLLPLLDEAPQQTLITRGDEIFTTRIESLDGALEHLLRGRDVWLKTCALYYLAGRVPAHLRSLVEQMASDTDLVVKETAELALSR